MADKIFLTQDRVLHRGALDAAQCHRAYAQVAMPFRFGVGSGRLTKRSCEKWREFLWLENPQAKVTDGAQVSRLTIEFQNLS